MKKDDVLYGTEDGDNLEEEAQLVVDAIIGDASEYEGEDFDIVADRIEWPIKVYVYAREQINQQTRAQEIAQVATERALEELDERYGNPDDVDGTKPTDKIKAAALAFGQAIVDDYESWSCKLTGEILEFSREQVRAELEEEEVFVCMECGQKKDSQSAAWRCTGSGWQHYHGYPIGHVDAVRRIEE